jgi:drug/metabolite transporter (DMT)-like permease
VTLPLAASGRLRSPRGVIVPTIISGIGEVAAFGAYIAASDRIGVAVPAVLASQFALIAATVGWVVLGERLGTRQLAGAGAILAGVTALTIIQG